MRSVNEDLMRDLAAREAALCLSLYLEVAPGGGEHDQIRIALKNAKAAAEEAIRATGADDAGAVRDRLDALDYDDVAGGHDRRVAVFIAPDLTEVVDARFDETGVHCGTRFRLSPLLASLEMTPEHAILLATKDRACLYRARGGRLRTEKVEGMPGSLADFTKFTDQQEKGNIHGREDSGAPGSYQGRRGAGGPIGVPHHSMGGHDWRLDKENDLRLYANALINAAGQHLSGSNVPLVVAADERLHGMIRENAEYPFLAHEGITLNPDELDKDRLANEAAACLAREVDKRRAEAWDKVAMSLGRGDSEASEDPADIVTAAAAGRVAHLFARAGARLPGRFDDQSLAAEADEDGPDDLVDRAIVETLRNGGDVFPLGDLGSGRTPLAAAYRYPA
jgi:hypothetical protein